MTTKSGRGSGLAESRRAQSSTVAVVLLLGITLTGTGAVVAFGATAIQDTKSTAGTGGMEHAMTQFDSRAALVALGDADVQSVSFPNVAEGDVGVEEDSGWLKITHNNYTAATPPDFPKNETVFNASLGSVAYESGPTTIAYEGGGVWRTRGNGTVMISPPEFHYRSATLTLPVIEVAGDTGISGSGQATVTASERARRVFPNASWKVGANGNGAPYDDTGSNWRDYLNPIRNGTVNVTVHSDHYRGWAQYFRTRTTGTVSVDDANATATLELGTFPGALGGFDMPLEDDSVEVPGMPDDHVVDEFTVTLHADNAGNNFNNMHWSLYQDTGSQDFEIHLHSNGKCSGGSWNGKDLDLSVYYSNGTAGVYQGWQNDTISPSTSPFFDVDCGDMTIDADFAGAMEMEYQGIEGVSGAPNKWYFGSDITSGSVYDTLLFGQHAVDGGPYTDGVSTAQQDYLVSHYFALLGPSFELTVHSGSGASDPIDEGPSSGTLDYDADAGSQFLTYLHVTENRVDVEFS